MVTKYFTYSGTKLKRLCYELEDMNQENERQDLYKAETTVYKSG